MPRETVSAPKPAVPVDYHFIAFPYLFARYGPTIHSALIDTGREFRRKHLRPRLRGRTPADHTESWTLIRPYLDEVEVEVSKMIGRHSTAYWFHLYRRLAPILSDGHDGNTDAHTAALVRQIADQAFVKYGSIRSDDLVPLSTTSVKSLLGGFFSEAALLAGADSDEALYRMIGRERWVIEKFELNDFLEIHRLESLFYEYWRTTAALRTIGKGTRAIWSEETGWLQYLEGVPEKLYRDYDASFGRDGGVHSLVGTWYPQAKADAPGLFFMWAQYNSRQIVRDGIRSNFDVGIQQFSIFWAANGFMADEFFAVHKVKLSALMYMLCALSAATMIPLRYIENERTDEEFIRLFDSNRVNLSMRAYTIFMYSKSDIIEHSVAVSEEFLKEAPAVSQSELEAAFDFLIYDPTKQERVSLWSGGQKFPLVPFGEHFLFDVAAVNQWREGLFFRVADRIGTKGTVFEDHFRNYLSSSGFEIVHHGELHWPDGSVREADALVKVGSKLVIFECVASERPVDFEISEPTRFKRRTEILTEKCVQAHSLAEKFRDEPSPVNLDCSWATDVEWFVVSHLLEFIWTTDFPAMEAGQPRILDPVAARDRLRAMNVETTAAE